MSRTFDALTLAKAQHALGLSGEPASCIAPSFAELLAGEFAQIERVVGESIGKIRGAVAEGVNAAGAEKAQLEQEIATLSAGLALLESKLAEAELSLQKRNGEFDELAATLDAHSKQTESLEQSLRLAKAEAINQAQRVAMVAADSKSRIAALEAKLVEAESTSRTREAEINQLQQESQAKIAQMAVQLNEKENQLTNCYQQIAALQSEMSYLKNGVREMAAAVAKQAEQLTADRVVSSHAPQMTVSLNGMKSLPPYTQPALTTEPSLLER